MKEDIKNIWVAALRSGEYQQGTGALNKNNKFCCLGVLCDLAIKNGVIIVTSTYSISINSSGITYDGTSSILPSSVKEWAGVMTRNGSLNTNACLSQLNDDGKTFEEIADIIEEKWEIL